MTNTSQVSLQAELDAELAADRAELAECWSERDADIEAQYEASQESAWTGVQPIEAFANTMADEALLDAADPFPIAPGM